LSTNEVVLGTTTRGGFNLEYGDLENGDHSIHHNHARPPISFPPTPPPRFEKVKD